MKKLNLASLPTAWDEIPWGDWAAFQESKKNIVEFFTTFTVEELEENPDVSHAVGLAFAFVAGDIPAPEKNTGFDFLDLTLGQKFRLDIAFADEKDLVPALLRIIEPDTDINSLPFFDAQHRVEFYTTEYSKNEEYIQAKLTDIPNTAEELAAGIKELYENKLYSRVALLNALTNNNVFQHNEALKLSLREVNTWLVTTNAKNAFEYRKHQSLKK